MIGLVSITTILIDNFVGINSIIYYSVLTNKLAFCYQKKILYRLTESTAAQTNLTLSMSNSAKKYCDLILFTLKFKLLAGK